MQPARWFHAIWPRAVAATGIGYLGVAYAVSRWLTRGAHAVVVRPELADIKIELLECTTSDGITLKGWALEPAAPRGTIALFHGMRLNRSHLLERIAFLTAAGYRCVAFDLRAHGESGGASISFGYHERHDASAIANFVKARWPSEPRAALGVSMGGAAVCFAGSAMHAFDAILLESIYHDLAGAFENRVGRAFPGWFKHFRRGIVWLTERRMGACTADVAPIDCIARLAPCPVLLLTGSDDPHAPPHEVQALAERLGSSASFHVIDGAGHGDVCERGGLLYRELVLGFFERHLFHRAPSPASRRDG